MKELTGLVTMKGNPLTLLGNKLKIGDKVPDCELIDKDLSPINLSSFAGKILVIASVPSLDTSVCDMETRKFNEEIAQFKDNAAVVTVSMDLPFAQKRWCGSVGLDNAITLSDHRLAAFGTAFGVLIKEVRLLARAVFIVDKQGIIRYIELVGELTNHPDYNAALNAVKKLL
jgi:thioredoxin-dependent peroxiredoxin